MKMHMLIRRFAGAFVLISLLLAHYHSPYWLWFTAFVGFNLLQSSFTNFCPLEMMLKPFLNASTDLAAHIKNAGIGDRVKHRRASPKPR